MTTVIGGYATKVASVSCVVKKVIALRLRMIILVVRQRLTLWLYDYYCWLGNQENFCSMAKKCLILQHHGFHCSGWIMFNIFSITYSITEGRLRLTSSASWNPLQCVDYVEHLQHHRFYNSGLDYV